MPKPKGGRGHNAPYETKLVRIPTPMADQVEELKERYQDFLDQGGEPLEPPPLLDAIAADHRVDRYEHQESAPMWSVGDLCACIQPSGVIIPEVKITNIDVKAHICKVYDVSTESHWSAMLDELIPIPVYKLISNIFNQNKQLKAETMRLMSALAECEQERQRYKDDCYEFETSAEQWRNVANTYLEELDSIKSKVNIEDKPVNELSSEAIASASDQDENAVEESVNADERSVDKLSGLNQQQLANLFGLSHTAVGKQKFRPTFAEWSKFHDPSGLAWRYDQKSRKFYPLED